MAACPFLPVTATREVGRLLQAEGRPLAPKVGTLDVNLPCVFAEPVLWDK